MVSFAGLPSQGKSFEIYRFLSFDRSIFMDFLMGYRFVCRYQCRETGGIRREILSIIESKSREEEI